MLEEKGTAKFSSTVALKQQSWFQIKFWILFGIIGLAIFDWDHTPILVPFHGDKPNQGLKDGRERENLGGFSMPSRCPCLIFDTW